MRFSSIVPGFPAAAWVSLLAALVSIQVVTADIIRLVPVADTTLQEAFPDANYGVDDGIRAGGRLQGGIARGLMRFDVAGNIPAGARINSASLILTVLGTSGVAVDSIFDLHRVTESWGEGSRAGDLALAGEASWNNRLGPGMPWTTAGGDFEAANSASQGVAGNGSYSFTSELLAVDVQFWMTNTAGNFGWLLRSESEGTPVTIRKFGGRASPGSEPALVIDFTPVPLLEISSPIRLGSQIQFSFVAESNRTYAVESRDSFGTGAWNVLANIGALPATATLFITNTVSSEQCYFRVRSP